MKSLCVNSSMRPSKVLSDLVSSATGAKAHYGVWWAQVSDAKPQFAGIMNQHSDFFRASQDAHYTACFTYFSHLFDKRSDSSSLPTYLKIIRSKIDATKLQEFEARYSTLATRAAPLMTVRHNAIAHINARLSEKDVFTPLSITWNEIRNVIYDVAEFVEQLAGAPHHGAIGIPRDGRLSEATVKLLRALK